MSGHQYLSEEGFRVDGRRASEMRKVDCSLGVFTQADGSAYVKQGNTVVLAAVYGPHEVRGGRVKVQQLITLKIRLNNRFTLHQTSTSV